MSLETNSKLGSSYAKIGNSFIYDLGTFKTVRSATQPDLMGNYSTVKSVDSIPRWAPDLNFKITLLTGVISSNYQTVTVTKIHKKDTKHDSVNYRHVSLTTNTCKTMNCFKRDSTQLDQNRINLSNDSQYIFMSNRSTPTNLFYAEENFLSLFDVKQDVNMVFLDLSKAYDGINHRLSLAKLEDFSVSQAVLE